MEEEEEEETGEEEEEEEEKEEEEEEKEEEEAKSRFLPFSDNMGSSFCFLTNSISLRRK